MEKNGNASTTARSRHVRIRYFFLKECFDKGDAEIKYSPTHEILADYFTKFLHRALFEKLWNVIMGHEHISTLRKETKDSINTKFKPCEIKERVGKAVMSNDGKKKRNNKDNVLSGVR